MRLVGKASVGIYVVLLVLSLFSFIPFYWMANLSFKGEAEFFDPKPSFFPREFTIGNYLNLVSKTQFPRWVINSFIVSTLTVVLGLFICSLAGFAFAKYQFKGKKWLFWLILTSVAIPETVIIIPVFRLMVNLRVVDTYFALVLPFAMNVFGIFLMRQYIAMAFPDELMDSARIDGSSEFGIFWRLVIPVVRPGLGVLAIFLWLHSWSSYFWPLIMLRSRHMFTLPLGLATLYADPWNLQYGWLMAGSVISTLPIMALFLLAQEQFISGLTAGAIK